jgi:hypothetical protein
MKSMLKNKERIVYFCTEFLILEERGELIVRRGETVVTCL